MEGLLLITTLLLVFIAIPVGVGLLFYFLPRKLGYPKAAKYMAIIWGLVVLTIAFFTLFEDRLFTRSDAKKMVEEQNIRLLDRFVILDNRSSSAIGDYYHTFTLRISENDKQEAIRTIRSSKDFKTDRKLVDSQLYSQPGYSGPKIIQNYETENSYVREYFQPSGRQGYAAIFRRISVSKTNNKLTFEDIGE